MNFTIEKTKNGKPHILYNNNKFRESYHSKNGDITWRCLGRNCKAMVKTNLEKTQILSTNDNHDGPHPVTMRSLVLTPQQKRADMPARTPAAESASTTASDTPTSVTPDLPGSSPKDNTPKSEVLTNTATSLTTPDIDSILKKENLALKNEISQLKTKMKSILDHAIQNDMRLSQYTSEVFPLHSTPPPRTKTSEPAITTVEHRTTQTEIMTRVADDKTPAKETVKMLEEEVTRLKRPCERCIILKEEASNMISAIKALEEQLKLYKNPSILTKPSPTLSNIHKPPITNPPEPLTDEETVLRENKSVSSQEKINNNKKRRKKNKKKHEYSKHVTAEKQSPIQIPFHGVTILGDSHTRHIAGLVGKLTGSGNEVSGVCKPGAGLLHIVSPSNIPPSANHCYVLIAGTNDVAAGKEEIIYKYMEGILQQLSSSSKVLVATLPHRHDLAPDNATNRTIRMVNGYITELCHRHKDIRVLEVNCIRRPNFTAHGSGW
ncbi:hypothetical protein J6590_108408 [Homalodisca vitripennis]|nr:hypothetical protein J6590_108408 [Homalodisca vitripennis]